ncbi:MULTISPECIES: aspartate kinase [unclassified Mucilaginibacter]|uniref:aspartate kinase n=1 Tax=unclassified Mucilaginibacter TaxID=2617802 RepID=UPI002AC8A25F|nr:MULTISPECIES: aspartate kinase [unclassified Mucilaginibacter]MEB0261413.1 aspartate kinase [Mucilaginibacter sp. 10I4]MEB0278828.1 aspartate kinase [Mucilaginibacter sp. 10B2]MEB0299806.1 aspartate kinase [Mucilaginibacter sp. 5C4]WPX22011.1 aspartate kinase [Mucilaginibacter sp. 5C4]
MLVFKFGGASVKDAQGVINLGNVVGSYAGNQILVVVSAMGKTTNALERLTNAYFNGTDDMHEIFEEIKEYHYHIVHELFGENHPVFDDIANTFVEIDWAIEDDPHDDYDFIYDQIVSIGELVSTRIVNAWFNHTGITSKWLDVRGYIHTDNTYREGVVDWDKTRAAIQKDIPAMLNNGVVVTQGFLGGTSENFTTTLGREGSDYTASIIAACLDAESVTTWKDVPGILNADPKYFANTIKFDELSYQEAIEMTYYGASVIHPKTIKPLQNARIPLLVKPFTDPNAPGTVIKEGAVNKFEKPVIIVKQNQVLLSLSANDYSFISESHLSEIFGLFAQHHVKVNMMQTSALSFTACIDYAADKFEKLLQTLKESFKVKYNNELTLLTLRHYTNSAVDEVTLGKTVLMKQTSRNTAQVVLK